jgi:hypothetical protein
VAGVLETGGLSTGRKALSEACRGRGTDKPTPLNLLKFINSQASSAEGGFGVLEKKFRRSACPSAKASLTCGRPARFSPCHPTRNPQQPSSLTFCEGGQHALRLQRGFGAAIQKVSCRCCSQRASNAHPEGEPCSLMQRNPSVAPHRDICGPEHRQWGGVARNHGEEPKSLQCHRQLSVSTSPWVAAAQNC